MSTTINKIAGRSYRTLVDNTPGAFVWNQLSFWTKASDVEFNDGETAEFKVGAMHGLTASTTITTPGQAADATNIKKLFDRVNQKVSAILRNPSTVLEFTNSSFDANTYFDIWVNKFGVSPTNVSFSGTTLTLTFKPQSEDITVTVYYFKDIA